jgi:hypothetical protein
MYAANWTYGTRMPVQGIRTWLRGDILGLGLLRVTTARPGVLHGVAQIHKLKRETYFDGGAKGVRACQAGWVRRRPEKGSGLMQAHWAGRAGSQEGLKMEIDEFGFWQDFEEFYKEI